MLPLHTLIAETKRRDGKEEYIMKINIKSRMKNPVFVTTFLATVVTFVYTILGMFGIVPSVSEDMVMQGLAVVIELMAAVGVLADPTTAGVSDSERAMTYTEPRKD